MWAFRGPPLRASGSCSFLSLVVLFLSTEEKKSTFCYSCFLFAMAGHRGDNCLREVDGNVPQGHKPTVVKRKKCDDLQVSPPPSTHSFSLLPFSLPPPLSFFFFFFFFFTYTLLLFFPYRTQTLILLLTQKRGFATPPVALGRLQLLVVPPLREPTKNMLLGESS